MGSSRFAPPGSPGYSGAEYLVCGTETKDPPKRGTAKTYYSSIASATQPTCSAFDEPNQLKFTGDLDHEFRPLARPAKHIFEFGPVRLHNPGQGRRPI